MFSVSPDLKSGEKLVQYSERSGSIVKPREPGYKTDDQVADEKSAQAWAAKYKELGVENEIPDVQPGRASDALKTVRASDAEVDALLDARYPVVANRIVAHEAQIDLTQQPVAQAPQRR